MKPDKAEALEAMKGSLSRSDAKRLATQRGHVMDETFVEAMQEKHPSPRLACPECSLGPNACQCEEVTA